MLIEQTIVIFYFLCSPHFLTELIIDNVKHPPKPFGTDDGFKGSGAACGSSIVKVAHQMVSAKSLGRGFAVAK